ncbi:magnesium/cobalt transporter CorA [Isosphaeraceae bacterium EP7]
MATSETTAEAPAQGSKTDPAISVLYRSSSGELHRDWPREQLQQALDDREGCVWIDIEDPGTVTAEAETLMRDTFQFHPLAIEDALQQTHIAKLDDWGSYLYLVFHTIDFRKRDEKLGMHELDIFLGVNYLLTYHTEPINALDQHRRNIERDPSNRNGRGAEHLLYHLLDAIVAEYLPAIEHLDDAIDAAQDEVFKKARPRTLKRIFRIKRASLRLYRTLSPQREIMNRLARDPFAQIHAENRVYFRDIYDHLVRTHDIAESLRDLISGALDTYLSAVSNRTNDIMKTLTLVTVMFLPMTFLVGFFGMNFFGQTLEFTGPPLPKATLFWASVIVMAATPYVLWFWSRLRGWF